MLGILVLVAFVALSFDVAPKLSPRDVVFGVTLAFGRRESDPVRRVRRRYRTRIWLHALVASALVLTARAPLLSATVVIGQTFGAFVAFAQGRRALLPYAAIPSTVREAEIGPRPMLPGGALGQCGPLVIVLAAAVYMGTHWAQVPPRFPTHWNIMGQPNGWTRKSVGGFLEVVWFGVVVCGILFTTSYGAVHWSRVPRVSGADGAAARRVRRANLLLLLVGEYMLATLMAWVLIAPTIAGSDEHLPLSLRVAPFFMSAVGLVTIAWLRASVPRTPAGAVVLGDATPDGCWYWGRLYWNAEDPAVFVERRFGFGYTLNFGNHRAWLLVGAVLLALILPSVLTSRL